MYIKNRKVDVFVIGAQKSGTTTLHEILLKEKDISLPAIKETHFFSDSKRNEKGISWYISNFDKQKKIWLEVDPDYTSNFEIIRDIFNYNPDAKIIFIYRDPMQRALSQWKMNKRRGIEHLDFNQALDNEEKRLQDKKEYHYKHFGYYNRSNYQAIILELLKYFPKDRLLLIDFRVFMKEDKITFYQNLCSFIGIESCLSNDDLDIRANEKSEPRLNILNKLQMNLFQIYRLNCK